MPLLSGSRARGAHGGRHRTATLAALMALALLLAVLLPAEALRLLRERRVAVRC